jgi:PAS domain S-box-containing protein
VVTWLLAAIERVASAGTARARTLAEARQVRVANTLALLCVAICAFSLPYDAVVAPPWVVIEDIVGVVMFAASPLLAARGLQRTARAMLLVTATLFVAFNALVLGKASGQHLLLLPLAVLPFMLFGHHERRQMLAASVCIGASILVIEVWGFDLVGRVVERPALSPHYETYSTLVVLVVLILSIRNFVVAHALTEDALRAEQERYRLITETARDAIVTIGANSRVVFASPASEGVFGTPPSALLDRDVDSLFTEALARAPTGGARLAVRADGARVPVEVSIGESRVDSGVRTLIIRDVTDRIRDQEQVDQARANAAASARLAALGVMSGGIAHEINNPLTALALAADRLRRHADSGTVTATDVGYTADRIRRITGRIDKIVSGLRFFARDGAGDAMEPTRLRELIDDTIDLCGREVVVADVAAEVRRVVAVDRHHQAALQQGPRLCSPCSEHAQLDVRQRAHRQRDLLAASRCTSASSSTQRTPWSMRWAPSRSSASLMYAAGPSSPACATTRKFSSRRLVEHRLELARRVAGLRAVEPDAAQPRPERQRRAASRAPTPGSGGAGSTGSAAS